MAITSYATLQTAIADYRERSGDSDFTAQVPLFIALAEARLNRDLKVRTAEGTIATLTGTTSSRYVDLPSDYLEQIALYLTTNSRRTLLRPYVPGTIDLSTTSGTPSAWAIVGSTIEFDCPCDQAHTFALHYRLKLFDLATTDPNWLLTNYPDVYLWAALTEAADREGDDAAVVKYKLRYEEAKDSLLRLEGKAKSRAVLTVDPGLLGGGAGFDISRGF